MARLPSLTLFLDILNTIMLTNEKNYKKIGRTHESPHTSRTLHQVDVNGIVTSAMTAGTIVSYSTMGKMYNCWSESLLCC